MNNKLLNELKEARKENAHYTLSTLFFTDDRYKKLRFGAKMLYAIIKDRINLSRKNGRLDLRENNFYCYFSNESLAELLGVSKRTIITWKNLLLEANLIYYIEQRGYKKSNKIFLVKETLKEIEKCNFYKISKRIFLENAFKNLSFREKIFFEILENKKSCMGDTTFLSKNVDLVRELNLSKPTIIKYQDELKKLDLINKQNSKITIKKTLLRNLIVTYKKSITVFLEKVKFLSKKSDKKYKKVVKIFQNVIEKSIFNLENLKIKKDLFRYIERMLELNQHDVKEILNSLSTLNLSEVKNIYDYVSKVIENKIENRIIQNNIKFKKDLRITTKFWNLISTI